MENCDCTQYINSILIRCGGVLLPDEKNISVLLKYAGDKLMINPGRILSYGKREFVLNEDVGPLFKCSKCGEQKLVINSLCGTCKASQKGKFKSQVVCRGCGFTEVSVKFITEWYKEFGFEFKGGSKKELGIKTLTDEGLK